MYDIAIVGKGPAGITAAIYGARSGFDVLVVGKDGGALSKAHKIQNYYGISDISGGELLQNSWQQAKMLGVKIVDGEVTALENSQGYAIKTAETKFLSKTVILATGANRNKPDITDADKLEGRGVSYCAVCDGAFYKGLNVCVLGNGDYAAHEIDQLKGLATVTLLTNGKPLQIKTDVTVVTKRINALEETDGLLSGIKFDDGTSMKTDGLFVAEGTAAGHNLAKTVGAAVYGSSISIEQDYSSSLPGLFAAGDCLGGIMQITKACNDGMQAAMSAIRYLKR